jgi:hypothetical protein
MRSDLVKMQVAHGDRVLSQALAIADRAALKDRLSITAAKARQDRKEAQALFARKP